MKKLNKRIQKISKDMFELTVNYFSSAHLENSQIELNRLAIIYCQFEF